MKSAESKTATAAQPASTQEHAQQPFFQKDGQGSFFSEESRSSKPFFSPGTVQPKLTIGRPGDKYEQEADAMAEKVVGQMSESKSQPTGDAASGATAGAGSPGGHNASAVQTQAAKGAEGQEIKDKAGEEEGLEAETSIQRKAIFESNEDAPDADIQTKLSGAPALQAKCDHCEQEEEVQKKEDEGIEEGQDLQMQPIFEGNAEPPEDTGASLSAEPGADIQRMCADCAEEENAASGAKEEPEVQTHTDAAAPAPAATPDLQSRLNNTKGGGKPLPEDTRSSMESGFGSDFSGVRVHNDQDAAQMNKELGAHAFTHGSDIYFNEGKYDTGSTEGKKLLAHELTHTVQQGGAPLQKKEATGPEVEGKAIFPTIQKEDGGDGPSEEEQDAAIEEMSQTEPAEVDEVENETWEEQEDVNVTEEVAVAADEAESELDPEEEEPEVEEVDAEFGEAETPDDAEPVEPYVPLDFPDSGYENPPELSDELTVPSFDAFYQEILQRRTTLTQETERQKEYVRQLAETRKTEVETELEARAVYLEDLYDTAIAQVENAATESRSNISTARTTQVAAVTNTANAQLSRLRQMIQEKKTAMRQTGGAKADLAIDGGNQIAESAIAECDRKIERVAEIRDQKREQYRNYDRAARISRVLGEMAAETMSQIRQAKGDMATQARQDAADLAQKFREEARENASNFDEPSQETVTKIEQERDNAIEAINQMADQAIENIDDSESEALAYLEDGLLNAPLQLRSLKQAVKDSIDEVSDICIQTLDQNGSASVQEIDQFLLDLKEKVRGLPDQQTGVIVAQSRDEFNIRYEENRLSMEQLVIDTEQHLNQASQDAVLRADGQIAQLQPQITETGQTTEANIRRIGTDTVTSINTRAGEAITEMQTAVGEVERTLQQAVADADAQWTTELNQGLEEIQTKINDVLAEQESAVLNIGSKMDEKAEEIENESWWSRG
jgi:hypothetical protein